MFDKVCFLLCAALLLAPQASAREDPRPNFIFVLADDVGGNDVGCYGDATVETPHLDRMASEGLAFDNAYLTTSSCSPSRCSIITGRYPHNTGAAELHMPLPAEQYMFPAALKAAGYYTVLSGKNHMGPAVKQAFSLISRGRGPGSEGDWVELLRERPTDRPFFFWFASQDAHRDWQFSDDVQRYDSDSVEVPSFLYDGPQTRQDLADYYHEVSRLDGFLGALRAELERQQIERETYVIFCSDNGRPFPRCKTRLYDSGIKTPLVIWRPGTVSPARSPALVSAIDLAPTLLELAGVARDPRLQGVSLSPVIEDPNQEVRDYVFAEHNWHVFQAHERMLRHEQLVYIRNSFPERRAGAYESTDHFPAGAELWRAEEEGLLEPRQRDVFLNPRPAEELFDLASDPDQLVNLVGSEEHQSELAELREVLTRWTRETGDSVPANPTPDRGEGKRSGDAKRRGEQPGSEHAASSLIHPGPLHVAGPHLGNGIKVGEVTRSSARVWTRLTSRAEADQEGARWPQTKARDVQLPESKALDEMRGAMPGTVGQVRVTHWPADVQAAARSTTWLDVTTATDSCREVLLEGLESGTEYVVMVEGRTSDSSSGTCRSVAHFGTAPAADESRAVSFCVITGQDYHRRDDADGHAIYRHMLDLEPDFLVNTGDTIYYDKPKPFARDLELARYKWNRIYALPLQREFHQRVPAYFLKDDHDLLKNDCWPGQSYGELSWEDGLRLFREQLPVGEQPYRTVRWGEHLQVWLVEGREFRSANTAPDGPEKTIWGAEQLEWLRTSLAESDASFRIVISPTPIVGPDRLKKNDNHANAGFAHEGRAVRELLAGFEDVVVICGDRHWQYVSRDPVTGLQEFSCGPTSDQHAGGFSEQHRSDMHSYLNVCGGFLRVVVELHEGAAQLLLQHHDADGALLHEVRREPRQ